ncbi:hypothetical protein HUE87_02710 [Candidatus Sulfurimonas marisnigri]|uniref:Uncharacterized protein n=1 Tax=Candidatus Sulfurimonas marisnigri TaxID=2740405 RepID=A0A7S7RR03_9BACT|nr:hypothetical protein [Candidatus Sulfurimonas marisnigri]QOY55169.1 hypothetical protein HUE87_02710 [Candidatus Sulfurimonas marisnigri]
MSQNSKHTRSENLTDELIEKIVKILDGWSGKLTWDKLIDEIEFRTKNKYTRQTLGKHQRIKDAYNLTKDRVSTTIKELPNMSAEVAALIQKVKRLEAENDRLNFENEALLAQFARWAYNAHSKGVTKEMLDKPLTPVDRGKTKQ